MDPQPCQEGSYCESGSANDKTPCRLVFFCPTPAVMIECPPGSYCGERSVKFSLCAEGYYCDGRSKVICSSGTYYPFGSAAAELPCSDGYYSDVAGSKSCKPCPVGYYCTNGFSRPLPCLPGQFANEKSSQCSDCPPGYACASISTCGSNATDAFHCVSFEKKPCLAVFFSTAGQIKCTPCAAGLYSSTAASSSCTLCPKGTYSFEGSVIYLNCEAGYFCDNGI